MYLAVKIKKQNEKIIIFVENTGKLVKQGIDFQKNSKKNFSLRPFI